MNRIVVVALLVLLVLFMPAYPTDSGLIPVNASIAGFYYYINISEKLSEGIFFTNETGSQENIQYKLLSGSNDNNAVWNYNKANQRTEYWVETGGNMEIDLCQGAVNNLCTNQGCLGVDNEMIDVGNAKWSSSILNDPSNPALSMSHSFIIGLDNQNKVVRGLEPYSAVYLRYWLDIPANTSAHDYNTTYQIMAVVTGDNCA